MILLDLYIMAIRRIKKKKSLSIQSVLIII